MAETFNPLILGDAYCPDKNATQVLNRNFQNLARILNDITSGEGIPGARITDESITYEKIVAETIIAGLIAAGAITTDKILANAVTAAKISVTDLIEIANKLTLASGRVIIDKDAFGTDLEGIIINDETYDRVEIGELTLGNYGINIRDSSGNITVEAGRLAAESDKKNLVVKVNATNPTYQIDVDAGHLKLDDSTQLLESINLTLDITASGANGLDTGSEAASTWYSIWVIHNPTSDAVAGLLSISTTSPTMPAGYTRKRRVGWVRNNASSNFLKFYQIGDWWYFDTRVLLLDAEPPATTFTDLDCSGVAPSTSPMISFYIYVRDDELTDPKVYLRRNDSAGDWIIFGATGTGATAARIFHGTASCPCDSSQIVEYKCYTGVDQLMLWVVAYCDPI